MKLEDIFNLWKVDSIIDISELGQTAIDISKLHNKYYQIYIQEKFILYDLEKEYKILKRDKFEFYLDGQNEETIKLGWELPPRGKILKTDLQLYLDADSDIINLTMKMNIQKEKIEYLISIIKMITYRNSSLTTAIEDIKFKNGG